MWDACDTLLWQWLSNGPVLFWGPCWSTAPLCSVMYWSIQTSSRMYSTGAHSARASSCRGSLRVALAQTRQSKNRASKKNPAVKDFVFYPADDFVSRENAVRFIFEAIEYKAFKLLAVGRITCILKSTVISRGGRVKSLRTCCVSCHGFWAFHMSTNSFFLVLDMQQLTKAGAQRFS